MGSLSPRMLVIQSFELVGGMTASLFPTVEILLRCDDRYSWALQLLAPDRERMLEYRSLVDLLFCELNPQYQKACRRFYAGRGKSLRALITEKERDGFNQELLAALGVARELYEEKRQESWSWYAKEVKLKLAS